MAMVILAMRGRPAAEPPSPDSMKIEIDAVARATPRRLAAPLRITDVRTHDALSFDPRERASGSFSYQLSKPAWVRVRLVSRRHPELLLRTLLDWSPRELGENRGSWDGRDASGHPVDRGRCPCLIVIEGDDAEHAAHDPERCGDMPLRITHPENGATITGRVMLRVELAGPERGYGDENGYTLRAYVDHAPAGERSCPAGERGPFEWEWDATAAAGGAHLLTVNLDDGRDHVGTASVEVRVRR